MYLRVFAMFVTYNVISRRRLGRTLVKRRSGVVVAKGDRRGRRSSVRPTTRPVPGVTCDLRSVYRRRRWRRRSRTGRDPGACHGFCGGGRGRRAVRPGVTDHRAAPRVVVKVVSRRDGPFAPVHHDPMAPRIGLHTCTHDTHTHKHTHTYARTHVNTHTR